MYIQAVGGNMAKGLVSCTGELFNVGDKVKIPGGRIIRVEGGAIAKAFYNAEQCEIVHKDTPTTHEVEQKKLHDANKNAGDDSVKGVGGGAQAELDCVIWGT